MFGTRLRETRSTHGLTQQYMADSLNIHVRSYQKYEGGERNPPFDILVKLADILDVSVDYLLGRDGFLRKHHTVSRDD